jgi:hypothetical protein
MYSLHCQPLKHTQSQRQYLSEDAQVHVCIIYYTVANNSRLIPVIFRTHRRAINTKIINQYIIDPIAGYWLQTNLLYWNFYISKQYGSGVIVLIFIIGNNIQLELPY